MAFSEYLNFKKWCRQHKGLWLNNLLVELWYCTLSIASLLRHVTSNLAYLHNWWTISLKLNLLISSARFSKDIFWHFNLCSRNESLEKHCSNANSYSFGPHMTYIQRRWCDLCQLTCAFSAPFKIGLSTYSTKSSVKFDDCFVVCQILIWVGLRTSIVSEQKYEILDYIY